MTLSDTWRLARRAGLTDPTRLAALGAAGARWGASLATLYAASALRHPTRAAVIDHRGALSFRRLEARSTALANGLRAIGVGEGDHLGVLCFNHRDFVEATVAAAKASLPVVYLNTGFAAPQLAEVAEREGVVAIICDAELAPVVDESGFDGHVIVADGAHGSLPTMRTIRHSRRLFRTQLRPRMTSPILLTSGTTGTPKGARRDEGSIDAGAARGVFERIPYRDRDRFVIPSPLFHAWGLSQLSLAAALGCPVVLVRRFEPEATLRAVEAHGGTVLAVVPIMLQRMLACDAIRDADLASLRIVASSGSALPGRLAISWMDAVGDSLYNLYGSTEVGQATIADPDDLRDAPGTAGRVVPGTSVELLDAEDRPVKQGEVGRIFVGNDAQFSGYTGGGTKDIVRGLMSSGDVGYFDRQQRLFVTGRADDMIVSGGENVFPQEVEDVLLVHPDVAEAAVIGVPDDEFGQRLAAFVVPRDDSQPTERAMRDDYVGRRLARHKVPRSVTFVEQLPRNSTGKLLRRALAD